MPEPFEEAAREMESLLAAARQPLIDNEAFTIAGQRLAPERIVEILSPLMTEARLARIDAVLAGRTYTVVPVVEGLINTGNVNAVMRSAEALGYQGFHIITNDADSTRYKSSARTSQGAEKWLDVRLWPTPASCAKHLKAEGYHIVATYLDEDAVPISDIDFTQKTALVFGNELQGITPKMREVADQTCIVPMEGFTQSFNISVAAAVCLYHAYRDRLVRQGHHGDLPDDVRQVLRALYCLKSVKHPEAIIERVLEEGHGDVGTRREPGTRNP